jgi:hypothetical protein
MNSPEDRPEVRARIRKAHVTELKRRGCIMPDAAVDAAVETTALMLQGLRACMAGMVEVAREEYGEMDSDDMERLAAIFITFWIDDKGQPHIPEELWAE